MDGQWDLKKFRQKKNPTLGLSWKIADWGCSWRGSLFDLIDGFLYKKKKHERDRRLPLTQPKNKSNKHTRAATARTS